MSERQYSPPMAAALARLVADAPWTRERLEEAVMLVGQLARTDESIRKSAGRGHRGSRTGSSSCIRPHRSMRHRSAG